MNYSDTTNKNGLLQKCEFWCNLGDGTITSNATLKAVFTALLNDAFREIMPLLLATSDYIKWDDTNHTDQPFGTVDIVSGQGDYQIKQDDNSLDILNITKVLYLPSSSSTEYIELPKMTIDDDRAAFAMTKNPSMTGIPSAWLEKDNTIFTDVTPNYSATAGFKVFFERSASYFATSDTTKKPGIPEHFHPILPKIASRDWLSVNKPENPTLITILNTSIAIDKKSLKAMISRRNPTRNRLVGYSTPSV